MADTPKRELASNVKCGHCGNVAPMEVVGAHRDKELVSLRIGDFECGTDYEMLLCPACKCVVLRSMDWGWDDPGEGPCWRFLYPSGNRTPQALPKRVARAYEAASRVRNIDPNAFAVLLGRVLDHVCADRGAAGRALNDRLNDLATKGEIPQNLADMAHHLRQLRNVGAHADLGELTQTEIPLLDDLCRAILEYVYSAPDLVARVKERLDELRGKPIGSDEGS